MKEGLIGVIVPVYKVEKYIAECIESILAQTYTNFRLILVDDGTPDNAGKICDEYAKKDSRITVIHQENTGVTRARARGVNEAADCEFITFVDADDTLPVNALYELYTAKEKQRTEIDIVIGYRAEINNGIETNIYNKIGSGIYDSADYINAMLVDNCSIGPWARLIKRTLFCNETFSLPRDVVQNEDIYMNISLACNAKKILIDNKIKVYKHLEVSETSQIHVNGYMKEDGWYTLFTSIKRIFTENGIYNNVACSFSRFVYSRIYIYNNYYKKRFKKCAQLNVPTFNKSQQNILWSNKNWLFFKTFYMIQRIKSFI